MNILVRTSKGKTYSRPDVTLERNSEDFYPPEFVSKLSYTPILYARICKPGKSIAPEFAERYYDGFAYGLLLYADDLIDGSPEGFACASCLDHTSFIPLTVYNKAVLGSDDNVFILKRNRRTLFRHSGASAEQIGQALAAASEYIPVRGSDVLAIELSPRKTLCRRGDGDIHIQGTFCDNYLLDFNIIL